jgi:HEAT repeat protein
MESDPLGNEGGGRVEFAGLRNRVRSAGETSFIVYGAGGSGKTVTLRALETSLLRQYTPVLFINASLIRTATVSNVRSFVEQNRVGGLPEAFWTRRVKKGEVVLLVDGIDELRREFRYDDRWKLLHDLVWGSHAYTVVATARHQNDDEEPIRHIRALKIQELTPRQVVSYLSARGLDGATASAQLHSMGLADLSRHPMTLGLFADLAIDGSVDQPKCISRAQLMRSAGLASMHWTRLPPRIRDLIEQGAPVLEHLWAACSARGHFSDSAEFERNTLLPLLQSDATSNTTDEIVDLFLGLGPVEHSSCEPGRPPRYHLIHERYSDVGLALGWGYDAPPEITHDGAYFGGFIADWCALQPDPRTAIRKVLAQLAKRQRFDTVVDILVADGALLDQELRAEIWHILSTGFMLSHKGKTAVAEALSTLPTSLVREGLAHDLLWGLSIDAPLIVPDVEEALLAGRLNGREFRRLHRRATRKSSVEKEWRLGRPMRADSGRTLAGEPLPVPTEPRGVDPFAGDDYAVAPDVADNDGDEESEQHGGLTYDFSGVSVDDLFDQSRRYPPTLAHAAIALLAARSSEPEVSALGQRLNMVGTQDKVPVIKALGYIGCSEYEPYLSSELSNEDRAVRLAVVKALRRVGSACALESIRAAASDRDAIVRGLVADALSRFGEPANIAVIIELMEDPAPKVRHIAMGAFGRLLNYRGKRGDLPLYPESVVMLARQSIHTMGDPTIGRFCKRLEILAVPDRVEILAELTRHTSANGRGAALTALSKLDGHRALGCAIAMLSDEADGINRSNAVNVIGQNATADHSGLVRRFLSDPSVTTRSAAAKALATMNDVGSVSEIAKLLSDRYPEVRGSACTALGFLGVVEAIPELIGLLEDEASNVRGSAAKALGYLGANDAVAQLCGCLTDLVPTVRGTAAVALGMIGDAIAVPDLVRLASDGSADVRRGAIGALGLLGDDSGLSTVLAAVADHDAAVRWNAANALARIGDDSAVPALVALLSDQDSHVRGAAATALGRLRATSTASTLASLSQDRFATVRGSVATALGRLHDPSTVPALTRLADDQDGVVRSAAITALGRTGSASATSVINRALTDPIHAVRGAAVWAVARLSPEESLDAYLDDPDGAVRRSALMAISLARRERIPVAATAMAMDVEAETRELAATALSLLSSDEAINSLRSLLHDQAPAVAKRAAESLARMPDGVGLPTLIDGVRTGNQLAQCISAETLGRYGVVEAVTPIQQLLCNLDPIARMTAAKALGQIGHRSSSAVLVAAMSDTDRYVRGTVATALGRVGAGSDDARHALIQALDDPHHPVVGLAAQALGILGGEDARAALVACAQRTNLSKWSRTAAIIALGPMSKQPLEWLRMMADGYRQSRPGTGDAKFRGAIVAVVSKGGWDNNVRSWLEHVVLDDHDSINKSSAANGLAARHALSPDLVRRLIAQIGPRSDQKKERDTDRRPTPQPDAIGAVIQAAIRSSANSPNDLTRIAQSLSTVLSRSDSTLIASAALAALRVLDLVDAERFLKQVEAGLVPEAMSVHAHVFASQRQELEIRRRDGEAFQALAESPERFVRAFTPANPPAAHAAERDEQPIVRSMNLAQEQVVKQISSALSRSVDYNGCVRQVVDHLLKVLVRFVSDRLDAPPSRKAYLFVPDPTERQLHQDLYEYLKSGDFSTVIDREVSEVGGGRTDLRVGVPALGFSVYIELKVDDSRKPLCGKLAYVRQTVAYQGTDVRIGFLVALRTRAFAEGEPTPHLTSLFKHTTVNVEGDDAARHIILIDLPGNRTAPSRMRS